MKKENIKENTININTRNMLIKTAIYLFIFMLVFAAPLYVYYFKPDGIATIVGTFVIVYCEIWAFFGLIYAFNCFIEWLDKKLPDDNSGPLDGGLL